MGNKKSTIFRIKDLSLNPSCTTYKQYALYKLIFIHSCSSCLIFSHVLGPVVGSGTIEVNQTYKNSCPYGYYIQKTTTITIIINSKMHSVFHIFEIRTPLTFIVSCGLIGSVFLPLLLWVRNLGTA